MDVRFDRRGLLEGARESWPIALGVFTYGLVFGLLARQAGLGAAGALSMSAFVFAGASQFVALGLWGPDLPFTGIVVTTLVVNLRHVLMGAALGPWFSRLTPLQAYGSLFFMNDESWALTLSRAGRGGEINGAYLLGSGLTVYAAWLSATLAGRLAVAGLDDPARWGLDFAFTAVFLSLLLGLRRGRSDLLPWLVAAAVSYFTSRTLPGKWHILAGALAGSLAAALIWKPAEDARPADGRPGGTGRPETAAEHGGEGDRG